MSQVLNANQMLVAGSDPQLPAPTLLGLSEHTPNGIETVGLGQTSSDSSPVLVFVGVVGYTYTLYDNGMLVGTMVATKSTSGWTLPALDNGEHNLSLTYATDAGVSAPLTFNFNVEAVPSAPVITSVVDAVGPLAGNVAPGALSTDGHPVINGTGHRGDTINVFDNNTLLGTAVVETSGKWSFQPETALANGAHNVHATETNANGTSDASAAYPFGVTYIMTTAIYDANGTLVSNGGAMNGAMTVTGWISDPSIAAKGSAIDVTGGNISEWTRMLGLRLDVVGNTFSVVLSKDTFTGNTVNSDPLYLTNGTFTIGVEAFGSQGKIMTMLDPRLGCTITNDFNGTPQPAATHLSTSPAADDAAALAVPSSESSDTQANHHTAVSEHGAFKGATGDATVDLNADPAAYFKETTAHLQGGTGGVNTLHLTGDYQVLDLTSLTGKSAAAKVAGIEAIDLGGAHNMLKLSMVDVLNLGETDFFQKDGKQQMLVNGSNGDSVDLSNSHIAGVADGHWVQDGTSVVGGVTYNVYEHSGAHAELLVQQGVNIALHG